MQRTAHIPIAQELERGFVYVFHCRAHVVRYHAVKSVSIALRDVIGDEAA